MWQRWNQTTHIFEKSTDNGSSWSPLGLSGAIITEGTIPNVAYKNIDNGFVAQTFAPGSWITGAAAPALYFNDTDAPANQHIWRWIGSGGNLLLQSFNDAMSVSAGQQIFYRDGAFYATNYIRAGSAFYELGRGVAQGQRVGWTPLILTSAGHNCGGSVTGYFSLIGYQLWWSLYAVNITIPAGSFPYMLITVPPGYPPVQAYTDQPIIRGYVPGIADEACYCQADGNHIQVYRPKATAWPSGVGHIIGQGFYWFG